MLTITWHGVLVFGIVQIPVGMALATEPSSKARDVSFKQLHKECLTPIKQKKWCPTHDRELSTDEIGKGMKKGDSFVLVSEEELDALKPPDSRSMDVLCFLSLAEVDPKWFDRTYYLLPGEAQGPYATMLQAMEDAYVGALCSYVKAGQEKWGLVRVLDGLLAVETMFLAEDVRQAGEVGLDRTVAKKDLELASQIIEAGMDNFDPSVLTSSYRENLHAMLSEGKQPAKVAPMETMTADLKASIAAIKKRKKLKKAA